MTDVKNLHPLEVKVLLNAGNLDFDEMTMTEKCSFAAGHANQAFSWLAQKGLIETVSSEVETLYEMTERGRRMLSEGFPEQRMFALLSESPLSLAELEERLKEEKKTVGSAFAVFRKAGAASIRSDGKVSLSPGASVPPEFAAYAKLLERASSEPVSGKDLGEEESRLIQRISKKRGDDEPFRIIERTRNSYRLTEGGKKAAEDLVRNRITGDEIGEITPAMLKSGSWKGKTFREYDVVNAPVSRLACGRLNPYTEFIRGIKDKLCAMGFEEFDGPLVENEFWNGDALFMPQFHPARDIHDVYYLEDPKRCPSIEEPYLSNVAATHENGWKAGSRGWEYGFDRDFTRRMLLRSQGTVLSAHQLTRAKIPGRYFGVVRCFRYDQVDCTHGADFYQTEGIVLGKNVNLRTLLGLLKMFATEIAGAKEVKYVPGYFPFTEPSIEVHIKHPVLGWFEMGGSGIFRSEVTKPLGIDCPVLAWGLGIDRMALMNLGLSDIRELFSDDIEKVRTRRG